MQEIDSNIILRGSFHIFSLNVIYIKKEINSKDFKIERLFGFIFSMIVIREIVLNILQIMKNSL